MGKEKILVINPGSTSTKVALYEGEQEMDTLNIEHPAESLAGFSSINDQISFRQGTVRQYLKDHHIRPSDLDAIAVRGGVVGQLKSGAYLVDEAFAEASLHSPAPHPANLSPVIGYELAREGKVHAYVYDAVCGCGVPNEVYTITGVPEITKPFLTHVLNSRAVCFEQAKRDKKALQDATYIVTHLGGGITTNLIREGRILDFVGDDEGALSPERSGGVPVRPLVKLCYSGRFTEKEMQARLKGKGGLLAYLGISDMRQVEEKVRDGDKKARIIFDAMVLQLSKDIASMSAVVRGKVDKIILTGGMAYSKMLTDALSRQVGYLAPVAVIPGTFEMDALAKGVLRVLRGEEDYHIL